MSTYNPSDTKIDNEDRERFNKSEDNFELLKNLILDEERKEQNNLKKDLNQIREILDDNKFKELVTPIIKEHLDEIKLKFPELYGNVVREAISSQIKNNEHEMVDAFYPIIGKMVKKFAYSEINVWVETFDKTFQALKEDFKNGSLKVKAIEFVRVKLLKKEPRQLPQSGRLLNKAFFNNIEEIFIIEKDTGFILASYADHGPFQLDQQMLVGLLTALKSFGEDVMGQKEEGLNTIQFDSYNIIIYNFFSCYSATVINGPVTETFKSELHERLLDFAEQHLNNLEGKSDLLSEKKMSQALKELIRGE